VIEKYDARRVKLEIRRVLLEVWDPIGIKDEPNAQDEYDGYLGGILGQLACGASDDEISKYLHRIVTERMELSAPVEAMRDTVAALRQIKLVQNPS
jgi:hypothetical protein